MNENMFQPRMKKVYRRVVAPVEAQVTSLTLAEPQQQQPSQPQSQQPQPRPRLELKRVFVTPQKKEFTLPIEEHKESIVELIRNNRVTVITGYTGSGKSTQVPQYIIDDCRSRSTFCKIVCTQPRRLAATSLAKRVASERGCKLGSDVGFKIGGITEGTRQTALMYATTGCLIEMIVNGDTMEAYSHVIMDEIHERDIDNDLLLNFMKRVLRSNKSVKLILMSATIDPIKFATYFREFSDDPSEDEFAFPTIPSVFVESGCYHVHEHYLEDCFELVPCHNKFKSKVMKVPGRPELTDARKNYSVQFIVEKHQLHSHDHAYLVFLPGIDSIFWFFDALSSSKYAKEFELHILHSSVSSEEQDIALQPASRGKRKIILATNVAESSITVPDVQVVIDFCLTKQTMYNSDAKCRSLNLVWISKDSGQQRKGRAGRVKEGQIYRMVTRNEFEAFEYSETPQIRREPLEHIILKLLKMNWDTPEEILAECIDPPKLNAIKAAYTMLTYIGAIAPDHELSAGYAVTPIGHVLSSFPVDLQLGRLILYGMAFGMLPECIIMASIVAKNANPVLYLRDKTIVSSRRRLEFAKNSESDIIAGLIAYNSWQKHKRQLDDMKLKQWCMKKWLSRKWLAEVERLVHQIESKLNDFQIYPMMKAISHSPKANVYDPRRIYTERDFVAMKLILGGAMMENMQRVNWTKEKKSTFPKNFNEHNSVELIDINNVTSGSIKQFFEEFEGGCGKVKQVEIKIEKKQKQDIRKAYVEFEDSGNMKASDAVRMALRLKRKDFARVATKATNNVAGTETSVEPDVPDDLIDDADVLVQKSKSKPKYQRPTDFLPSTMMLDHPLRFEFVKAHDGIANLELKPLHYSTDTVFLSSSSVVYPILIPQTTTELAMTIIPSSLYGVDNNRIFLASENTLLPQIPGIAELIMLLFAKDISFGFNDEHEVAELVVQDNKQYVRMNRENEKRPLVDTLRSYIHKHADIIHSNYIRRDITKTNPVAITEFDSPFDAQEALFDLVAHIEELLVVPKQVRNKKDFKNHVATVSIPDGSLRQICGRNNRNLDEIAKKSSTHCTVLNSETIEVRFNTQKEKDKATLLIHQALNNYFIVFEHPQEAYVVLCGTKKKYIQLKRVPDPRNIARELYGIYGSGEQVIIPTGDDIPTNLQTVVDSQKEKLVKGCICFEEQMKDTLVKRLSSAIVEYLKSAEKNQRAVLDLCYGKQLFYKAANHLKTLTELSTFPVHDFKNFNIGSKGDIKTEFLNAIDVENKFAERLISRLQNLSGVECRKGTSVYISLIQPSEKKRFSVRCTIDKNPAKKGKKGKKESGKRLAIKRTYEDRTNHFYMALCDVNSVNNPDYRLVFRSKKIVPTNKEMEEFLQRYKFSKKTKKLSHLSSKKESGLPYNIDIVRHSEKWKFTWKEKEMAVVVRKVTTDTDCSYEVNATSKALDTLMNKREADVETIQSLIQNLLQTTMGLLSQQSTSVGAVTSINQ